MKNHIFTLCTIILFSNVWLKAQTYEIDTRLKDANVTNSIITVRERVVKTYIESLNTANIDKITGLFSSNAQVIDPLGSKPIVGIANIRSFYLNGPFLHPIKAALDGQVRVSGNSAAFAFTAFSDGKKMHIIDVFEFDNKNKIIKIVAYWSHKNVSK